MTIVVSLMIFAKTSWRSFNQEFAQQLENFQNHRRSVEKEAELAHMSEEAESRALIRHRMLELEKKKQGQFIFLNFSHASIDIVQRASVGGY